MNNMSNQNFNQKTPKYCPSCGAEIDVNTRFCIICGNENPNCALGEKNQNQFNAQKQKQIQNESIGNKISELGNHIASVVDGVVKNVANEIDKAFNSPKNDAVKGNRHEKAESEIKNNGNEKKKNFGESTKPEPPIKTSEFLAEGIFALIFGVFAHYMPIQFINEFLGSLMVIWLISMSRLYIAQGIIRIMQSFFGMRMILAQQILTIIYTVFSIMYIDESIRVGNAIRGIQLVVLLGNSSAVLHSIISFGCSILPVIVLISIIIHSIVNFHSVFTLRSKYRQYLVEYNDFGSA